MTLVGRKMLGMEIIWKINHSNEINEKEIEKKALVGETNGI